MRFFLLFTSLHKPTKYHLGKAAYVIGFIEGLKKEGVPVQKLINKSSLRYFSLEDPEKMIPVPVIYEFFELVQKNQGIDDMGAKFYKLFSLETIGAYGDLIATSKKILPAILNALKYEKLNLTHDNCEFKILDGKTVFYGNRYGTAPCAGQDFLNAVDIAINLEVAKNANDEGWCPLEIHLRDDNTSVIEQLFPKCQPKILVNQEKYGFVFEMEMLSNSILSERKLESLKTNLVSPPITLTGKIEHLFDTLSNKTLPGFNEVAAMLDTSVSSLKRDLGKEDVTFSQLLIRWRFTKAIELLTKSDYKINEIGERLFYSNTANFVRAFKGWSGLNPTDFR